MRNIYLSHDHLSNLLYPFGRVRPLATFRMGILPLAEKWRLRGLTLCEQPGENTVIVPANLLADNEQAGRISDSSAVDPTGRRIEHPWHISQLNSQEIVNDFSLVTGQRASAPMPIGVLAFHAKNIFIEPGAKLYPCWLNAEEGPIYIGEDVLIMEGASIRGPVSIGKGSVVKMGARVYGGTSIGQFCTVGGEIKNSVIQDYANKAHDGYLGDSVLGEWCNLGAGTSNSNLKNTASEVRVWSAFHQAYLTAGIKAGIYMGDYSRSSINTSFNTGSVIGVSCHVFGQGLTPKMLPDFSWGYPAAGLFRFDKAITSIQNWKKLKNKTLEDSEIQVLKHIFEQSLKTN